MANPALILVVGMHRSGTSLLGNLLATAGVKLPGTLIEGDRYNPAGYFERVDITAIQEQLLIALNRWWPGATGMLPLPPDWLCRKATHTALGQLRGLLEQERDRAVGAWAIKDPRTSLLLPLWKRLCGELGIPIRLVHAVRPPGEVIHSLCRRDAEPAGMDEQRAEQLWWHHNRMVLRQAGDLPLLVIDDRRWFAPEPGPSRQLQQLLRFCGLNQVADDSDLIASCLAQIRPQHRHSACGRRDVAVQASTQALYGALSRGDLQEAAAISSPATPAQAGKPLLALKARVGSLLMRSKARSRHRQGESDARACRGWFDASFYRRCYPDLLNHPEPLRHYLEHGWLEGRQPHPLFDPGHYLQACQGRGLAVPADRSPLLHFLERGLALGVMPSPLLLQTRWARPHRQLCRESPPALTDLHPWARAALALADHDAAAATALLEHWLRQGIPAVDWRSICQAPGSGRPWPPNPPLQNLPGGQSRLPRSSSGLPLDHWLSHGWLASLNQLETGEASAKLQRLQLLLLPPGQAPEPSALLQLAQDPGLVIADPDPERCRGWERLGLSWLQLPAPQTEALDAYLAPQPWLERAAQHLGLPYPSALSPGGLLCLGSGGPSWHLTEQPDVWQVPGFHELQLNTTEEHRALAAWLWQAHRHGLRLIRLDPRTPESQNSWAEWLPMAWFKPFGLPPAGLRAELAWRDSGRPLPPPVVTVKPSVSTLWSHEADPEPAQASVVVSLFNYADRVVRALASVHRQTLTELELVVVDDASEDHSTAVVLEWLNQHGCRFHRAQLLRHHDNSGLAAARNTAFAHSRAPWCFVLDADNELAKDAVEACLNLALQGSTQLAVVHPLIRRQIEGPGQASPDHELLSRHSWQPSRFARDGNHVDAMALIRRSAWETVGGFHHIPGGWEDFDFWCCLIDAGYHGVMCPRPLATYTVHHDSMLHSTTNTQLRPLSRLLQHRHPWLHLPLGHADH